MGSFNTTCFASQQTIAPHDRVTIIPIARSVSYNKIEFDSEEYQPMYSFCTNTCHSDAFWHASGPILTGKYDDYGYVILDINDTTRPYLIELFQFVHKYSVVSQATDRDPKFDFSELFELKKMYTDDQLNDIWHHLEQAVGEYRVFITDRQLRYVTPFSFAILHTATADWLTESVKKTKNYLNVTNSYENIIKQHVKECFEYWFDEKKFIADPSRTMLMISMQLGLMSQISVGNSYNSIAVHWYKSNDTYTAVHQLLKQHLTSNMDFNVLVQPIVELMRPKLDAVYLLQGLGDLNIRIEPMVYATQDYSNEIGTNFLKMVKAVNKEVKQAIKSRYEE
jgi:hypothetical protein